MAKPASIAQSESVQEEWRSVPGFVGIYEVSTLGRVRSLDREIYKVATRGGCPVRTVRRGKLIKLGRDSHGYYMMNLCWGGVTKSTLVHHIVLTAFVGPRPDGMECRHLDGTRSNNRLANLAWGTALQNSDDKKRHGTVRPPHGESHGRAKLDVAAVRKIRSDFSAGKSAEMIGHEHKISGHHARRVARKLAWVHVK